MFLNTCWYGHFLVCGTCARSLSAPFSYILYICMHAHTYTQTLSQKILMFPKICCLAHCSVSIFMVDIILFITIVYIASNRKTLSTMACICNKYGICCTGVLTYFHSKSKSLHLLATLHDATNELQPTFPCTTLQLQPISSCITIHKNHTFLRITIQFPQKFNLKLIEPKQLKFLLIILLLPRILDLLCFTPTGFCCICCEIHTQTNKFSYFIISLPSHFLSCYCHSFEMCTLNMRLEFTHSHRTNQ
jgi:hypothetical protein